jgi:hypothetical protein
MDIQSNQDNKTDIDKTVEEVTCNDIMNICNICKKNNKNENYISWVHKWRPYGGYSKYEYPRYFCSTDCLENFERNFRCNHCHIVTYDWNNYKKGPDGMTYCDDELEITIGDTPCYNIKFPNID